MQLLELFCGDIRISTLLSWLDSGNPSNNMADQVSMFPPGKIKVAAKFADGRYLIACSTKEGPYAYSENGKTFDITISIGNLHFDSKSKLVFEWFKTEQNGDADKIKKAINKEEIVWAEMLEVIKIDKKPRSQL
jgi:hypothetical protein